MVGMRKEAEDSYKGKLDRMGLGISTSTTGPKTTGHQRSMADGTDGEASGERASGYATEAENEATLEAKAPKKLRLDRKGYANGGAVGGKKKASGATVNVIIAPQGGGQPPAPPMPPPQAGPPPPMMKPPAGPMPPPGGGMEMPPGGAPPMMRAHGGRVPHIISDGAGGGKGRLQKIKAYGDRAKPGGKAGTM